MKIYLDLVALINFIFDFILLTSVNYILRRNQKLFRLFIGALTGSLTIIIIFINLTTLQLLLFKFLTSILILLVSFGYQNFRYLLKNILYFYMVSMLLGGGIYFLNNQFAYTNNGLIFTPHSLGSSYIIILIISIFIFYKYLHSITSIKTNYNHYYQCKLYFPSKTPIELTAFLDTGNQLIDPITKKNIILIDNNITNLSNLNPIYVPYNTLNNHGLLTCYKAEKIEIEGRCCHHFLVGVSDKKLSFDGINCIINSRIMEELK